MSIQLSELEVNPAKYFELAKTIEVIVMCDGRRLGRIIGEDDEKTQSADTSTQEGRDKAFEEILRLAKNKDDSKTLNELMQDVDRLYPSIPDDTVYDEYKEMRLREKGLLP